MTLGLPCPKASAKTQTLIVRAISMAKLAVTQKKRRGRPYASGITPQYAFRVPKQLMDRVEKWAKDHEINRAEAIRQLLELALSGKYS
jgi:hypothetical protein